MGEWASQKFGSQVVSQKKNPDEPQKWLLPAQLSSNPDCGYHVIFCSMAEAD